MCVLQRLVPGLAMLGAIMAARAAVTFDLPPGRPGVNQPIDLHPAAHRAACAALLPRGSGAVDGVRKNFLIRAADEFAAAGITIAATDTPSDHPGGVDRAFSTSAAPASDTAAITAFPPSRAPAPVCLLGTSRRAISAAPAGVQLGPSRIAGVVLTWSVWVEGMQAMYRQTLRVPTLIVHNRQDGCPLSPFYQAAPAKELIVVSNWASLSRPCDAMSPPGYLGSSSRSCIRLPTGSRRTERHWGECHGRPSATGHAGRRIRLLDGARRHPRS
jgi:hypothetical protein